MILVICLTKSAMTPATGRSKYEFLQTSKAQTIYSIDSSVQLQCPGAKERKKYRALQCNLAVQVSDLCYGDCKKWKPDFTVVE